jgi:hypothetical protein
MLVTNGISLILTAFGKREFWETRYAQLKPEKGELTYDWYLDWTSGLSKIFKEHVAPYQRFVAGTGLERESCS